MTDNSSRIGNWRGELDREFEAINASYPFRDGPKREMFIRSHEPLSIEQAYELWVYGGCAMTVTHNGKEVLIEPPFSTKGTSLEDFTRMIERKIAV